MQKREQIYHFSEGLIAGSCGMHGREVVHTHLMCYLLAKYRYCSPTSFTELRWEKITAGDEYIFQHDELSKGYLYLTYYSSKEQTALLNVRGHLMLYVNGIPRAGDMHAHGWMDLPVKLEKGLNEILIQGYKKRIGAKLILNTKKLLLHVEDATVPHVVIGENRLLRGSVVVKNLLNQEMEDLCIHCQIGGETYVGDAGSISSLTTRKLGFIFSGRNISARGIHKGTLQLYQSQTLLNECVISIFSVKPHEPHNRSFISQIDASVQYYSVVPQAKSGNCAQPAIILSLHGASVMALNHAKAYKPKNWATIVVPTNRRPLGYKWEDWGRIDAMEVLEKAKQESANRQQKVFLTGHCMGGWGVWYLGALCPGHWQAIAPCAGYTTTAFRLNREEKHIQSHSGVEEVITRAANTANLYKLLNNYKSFGVVITHGDNDETIPVEYSRDMHKRLAPIHTNLHYIEKKGASHWYGDESVDAPHIFDFFKKHYDATIEEPDEVDFSTANIGTSYTCNWVAILQQEKQFTISRVKASRRLTERLISLETDNVSIIQVNLQCFKKDDKINIMINHETISYKVQSPQIILSRRHGLWTPDAELTIGCKTPARYGTFKEAFNHNMIFVFGTSGIEEENNWNYYKARYDAETWYYRANGSVEVISDKTFLRKQYDNRGIILYGNSTTNAAWDELLNDSPIDVSRGRISIKGTVYAGDDLGAYFIRPNKNNNHTSVAAVCATGIPGMRAIEACQYFNYRVHLPDYLIFRLDMLTEGSKGVTMAGFFGNDWSFENGEVVQHNPPLINVL